MPDKSNLSFDRISYDQSPDHAARCKACSDHSHLDLSERGFVYFVQAETSKLIKIGFSAHPEFRLRELRTGSAESIKIIAMHTGGRRLETLLHRAFKEDRVRGEWFRPSPGLLKIIARSHRQFTEPERVPLVHEREITEQFGIPRTTLIRLAKEGKLTFSQLGKWYWFSVDEVQALLEAHVEPAKTTNRQRISPSIDVS